MVNHSGLFHFVSFVRGILRDPKLYARKNNIYFIITLEDNSNYVHWKCQRLIESSIRVIITNCHQLSEHSLSTCALEKVCQMIRYHVRMPINRATCQSLSFSLMQCLLSVIFLSQNNSIIFLLCKGTDCSSKKEQYLFIDVTREGDPILRESQRTPKAVILCTPFWEQASQNRVGLLISPNLLMADDERNPEIALGWWKSLCQLKSVANGL